MFAGTAEVKGAIAKVMATIKECENMIAKWEGM